MYKDDGIVFSSHHDTGNGNNCILPQTELKTGNLTVNVNEGNTLKGQTIKVYKLFDLSVSDTHYAYTVNADYKNAIATALGFIEGSNK